MSSISAYPLPPKSNRQRRQAIMSVLKSEGIEKVAEINNIKFLITIKMTKSKMVILGDNFE